MRPDSSLYIIQINASNSLPDHGGIATYTHELAHHMEQKGASVILLTYPAARQEIPSTAYRIHRSRSFDLRRLIQRGGKRIDLFSRLPVKILAMVLETVRTTQNLPEDGRKRILWAVNWWPEAVTAFLASRVCGIPYVVTAHGYEAFVSPRARRHVVYRKVMNQAERVFAVSRHTAGILSRCGIHEEKIRVLHNGVCPERFIMDTRSGKTRLPKIQNLLKEDDPPYLLLTIARLIPRKGHSTVLNALKTLKTRIPRFHYVVAGGGPLKDSLVKEATDLGLEDRVLFLGEISEQNKVDLLHACDVFVMPNRDIPLPDGGVDTEGFGIVFLEAAACEKPVIGGKAGGVPEAVLNKKTGILANPLSPEDVADVIFSLWKDRDLAGRLGQAGKTRVTTELNWERISEKYLEQLRELC